jgi:hypothetical protein
MSANVKEKTSHLEMERQFMVLSYGKRRHIFWQRFTGIQI